MEQERNAIRIATLFSRVRSAYIRYRLVALIVATGAMVPSPSASAAGDAD